jgi:hypothetical protein
LPSIDARLIHVFFGPVSLEDRMLLPFRLFAAAAILAVSGSCAFSQVTASSVEPRTIAGSATSVTVDGFIHEVTTGPGNGVSQGTHVMVDSLKGTVEVNAGPWLSPDLKSALAAGKSVHVTGMQQTVNGKEFVLAQQITIGGQTFTVRNANGMLARPRVAAKNGGAR